MTPEECREIRPDLYDDYCPTCDAPVPTHTMTCAVVHLTVDLRS